MSKEQLSQELSSAYQMAINAYNDCVQSDRFEQVQNGASHIAEGWGSDKWRQSAETQVYAIREKARAAIERERLQIEREMTEAPDTEAANYITSIKGRTDLSPAEVEAALKRYPTHAAQKAIRAAAIASGLTRYEGQGTAQEQYLSILEAKAQSIEKAFTCDRISEGRARQELTAGMLKDLDTDPQAGNAAWLQNMFGAVSAKREGQAKGKQSAEPLKKSEYSKTWIPKGDTRPKNVSTWN